MQGSAGIDARWYAPLLRPVMSTVSSSLEHLAPGEDPWSPPRAGLGGAMVIHVSRAFGLRGWRRAERVAVAALEGYNHRVHVGEPTAEERAQWLARDLKWARKTWRSLLEDEEPTVSRVIARLLGPHAEVCDRPIPEAVLFLRCAVAAGVVIGDVPEPLHETLDRLVTWLGLSWEAGRGGLDARGWDGALGAVGLSLPFPDAPESEARARALAELAALPDKYPVDLLRAALARPPEERSARRHPQAWTPMRIPPVTARREPSASADGAFTGFAARFREPIEAALEELTRCRSTTMTGATDYLRGQGGKRVRPVLALAAAEACGGDARRALPLAAAVEWLHQGTLVLDDIVDAARVRRGHPALHEATSDVFAVGVAVFVFGRVLERSRGVHPDARRHLVGAATALAEGERLELQHTGDGELPLTLYYRVIEAKTARLFSCAAALGGLCVEAPSARVRALGRFGREVGLAFQIMDDLLDYLATEDELGKQPGTDLRAAKCTLPFLALRDRVAGAERERLLAALGRDDELPWVRGMLLERGVVDACRARVEVHVERAVAALDALPASEGRDALGGLARELGVRRC